MIDTMDVKKRLKGESERLLRQISRQNDWCREFTGYGSDAADKATENFERARNFALRSNLEHRLREVEDALCTCERGSYGLCERCGQRIDPARLNVLAYATLCIGCKQYLEKVA